MAIKSVTVFISNALRHGRAHMPSLASIGPRAYSLEMQVRMLGRTAPPLTSLDMAEPHKILDLGRYVGYTKIRLTRNSMNQNSENVISDIADMLYCHV